MLNYLGYSFVEMNQNLDEALEMIERAVERRPDSGYITDSLGWVLYRLLAWVDGLLWDQVRFGWVRPGGIPGVGFVTVVLLVLLVGLVAFSMFRFVGDPGGLDRCFRPDHHDGFCSMDPGLDFP